MSQDKTLTDQELGKIAEEGFDSYWHPGSAGRNSEAWAASAKAVIAAHLERTGQSVTNDAAWAELRYDTPQELYAAFKSGQKFVLHYHGKSAPVTNMRCVNGIVFVYPREVKIQPNGKSGEGPGESIWLEQVATPPEAATAEAAGKAPASVPSYEVQRAVIEGERNAASDAYYKARDYLHDTRQSRDIFDAGFDRGWDAALAAQPRSTR